MVVTLTLIYNTYKLAHLRTILKVIDFTDKAAN